MRLKTSDYIAWDDCEKVEQALFNSKQYRIFLYLAMGKKFGLRAKDMLSLRWSDILNKSMLVLSESKTGKIRQIPIANDTQQSAKQVYEILGDNINDFIFKSWSKSGVMSSQYISQKLRYYAAPIVGWNKRISTHSTRKTMGRRVLETQDDKNYALIMLNDIFNHSSIGITRRYLGITEQEKQKIYQAL